MRKKKVPSIWPEFKLDGLECKLVQSLWKTIRRFLKKLKIELPYDLAYPLLGIYPKELISGSQRAIHTLVFTAALFIIA